MRAALEFVAANLFLLAIVGIAAGLTFLAIHAVRVLEPHEDIAGALWVLLAIAIPFGTYYAAKGLHALLARYAR